MEVATGNEDMECEVIPAGTKFQHLFFLMEVATRPSP